MGSEDSRKGVVLLGLLLLYAATSLLHFWHNAEYLSDYPNLPGWLTRAQVYLSWCGLTALGVLGYGLYRRAHARAGLVVLAVYGLLGFDGLLHYRRAPFASHTLMMNSPSGPKWWRQLCCWPASRVCSLPAGRRRTLGWPEARLRT
jgi:hypothetical protein